MVSKAHKYIAHTFYSDKMITKSLSSNYVIESNENTDVNAINFKIDNDYDSIYEEQILKKDKGNDLYKIIDIKTSKYTGHIAVIYEPSRIELITSGNKSGEKLENMSKTNDAILGINAGGFVDYGNDDGGTPVGVVIKDGKLVNNIRNPISTGGIAGFNKENVLVLTKGTAQEALNQGIKNAVEFGPFLMVNGTPMKVYGNGGGGRASRTVLAQRKDGIVLFIVIDGENIWLNPASKVGADMNDLIELLTKYGAYNAINLDGGSSSSLTVNGKVYSKPCACVNNTCTKFGERKIPNAWILK